MWAGIEIVGGGHENIRGATDLATAVCVNQLGGIDYGLSLYSDSRGFWTTVVPPILNALDYIEPWPRPEAFHTIWPCD